LESGAGAGAAVVVVVVVVGVVVGVLRVLRMAVDRATVVVGVVDAEEVEEVDDVVAEVDVFLHFGPSASLISSGRP